MAKEWKEMTPRERQQARFDRWLNADNAAFASQAVERDYQARVQRVIDAIRLEKTPDRVPTWSPAGFLPCTLYGVTYQTAMADIDIAVDLWLRFAREYPTDIVKGPAYCGTAKAMEILDYQLYKWPGHGLTENVGFQAVEGEWMKKEEYGLLMDDPSDFWLRHYMPRIFKTLAPMAQLAQLSRIIEFPNVAMLANFGLPEVRQALTRLADAGEELLKARAGLARFRGVIINEMGFPLNSGGGAKAPFDVLADTLRASRGMIMDMFRQPGLILEAIERITPLQIKGAVADVNASGNPFVFIPLHKGADGFMSDAHFQKLYWPSLKQVILALVEEGCVPQLFAEGGYASRLEYLQDLPAGTTLWLFDQTDMALVKKKIGDRVCISGNVPSGLMITGTAGQVDDYCRRLIDSCAPGGGFILNTGASLDEGNAATTRALIDSAGKYGRY